ncbi:hypothetical protein GCM10023192_32270 [Amycolatopsis samaneae]
MRYSVDTPTHIGSKGKEPHAYYDGRSTISAFIGGRAAFVADEPPAGQDYHRCRDSERDRLSAELGRGFGIVR